MAETLREIMARFDERQGNMHDDIKDIKQTLNGGEGELGMVKEVDRNTEYRRAKRRYVPSIIAVIAVVVMIIFGIIQIIKEYHE